jgi:chromosome segregation ATPase
LFFVIVIVLSGGFYVRCYTGPSYQEDSDYRAIERDSDQNSINLAITGTDIAAGVKEAAGQAARVEEELEGLEAAIQGTGIADAEKATLLHQVSMAQREAAALSTHLGEVNGDVERLNVQLAEQRKINAALSAEHDRREAAGAAVKAELEGTKGELAKVKGQRNLYLAILIAVCIGVLGYIVFRALQLLRIIPV